MSAQRLRFAGADTFIGFVVLALFGLFAGVGLLGTLVLLLTGRADARSALLGALALAVVTGGLGAFLVGALRRFRTLVIEGDGTWRLLDLVGRERLRLPPEAPRAVDVRRVVTWYFTGTALRVPRTWIEIELPDGRRFRSLRSAEGAQAPAIAALRRHVEVAGR